MQQNQNQEVLLQVFGTNADFPLKVFDALLRIPVAADGPAVPSLLGSQGLRQRREPRHKCWWRRRQDAAVCLPLCAPINDPRANGAQQAACGPAPLERVELFQ